ncbi:MAG: sugar ABC transporter permease [Spirochaetia bacterium]|nr:sugar ABC transporter permease [Spirochaetia bacterium]
MSQVLKTPKKSILIRVFAPILILYFFVFVFPIFFSLRFSFLNWTGGSRKDFIGLKNYAVLFKDKGFWSSVLITLKITAIVTIGQVGLGLIVAILLVTMYVAWGSFHRTVIFLPVVISPVVVGLVWSIIYNHRFGVLTAILTHVLHIPVDAIPLWLDNPSLVLYSVCVPVIWQYVGLYMIMLLGALESIPKSILESGQIDGTNQWQLSFKIMLPCIYPTFKVAVILCVSGTLKIFDHIFVLTGGGPAQKTMTMSLYNYRQSFDMMKLSYGSAMAIIMIIISLAITYLTLKGLGGKRYE